jgi:DNA mismatch endonuclease Vsr
VGKDTLSREERSVRMGLVRNKDTKPELLARRLTYAMGFRYRLHARELPGHPDMVFTPRGKVIFVHGCFAWSTVRDPISDLPDPARADRSFPPNHKFMPGARSYVGHTGSPLDEPAKTLKAGDHGVPGGENTLAYGQGRIRYFTIRESSRLQTFPDDYAFRGSWSGSMRQLGNAVPVKLAQLVAGDMKAHLVKAASG